MRLRSLVRNCFLCFLLAGLSWAAASAPAKHRAAAAAPGAQRFGDLGNFRLQSGQVIRHMRLGYRLLGHLNPSGSNAILWPTWFTGTSAQLLELQNHDRIFDTRKDAIIFVDAIGDGVSTSPSNSSIQPGRRFPRFTIADMVHAEHRLATRILHLPHLHVVTGMSMGGMQSFQWAVSYPGFVDDIIPVVGSPRLTSYDLLLWRTEIDIIRNSTLWQNGHYKGDPPLMPLLELHNLNLTTPQYRVTHTPRRKFERFLHTVDTTPTAPFDLNDWIRQAQAMMALDVSAPFGGNMARAAAVVRARMLIIPSAQDHMVNPTPALKFARLVHAQTYVMQGDCGHIASGCNLAKFKATVRAFLAR